MVVEVFEEYSADVYSEYSLEIPMRTIIFSLVIQGVQQSDWMVPIDKGVIHELCVHFINGEIGHPWF